MEVTGTKVALEGSNASKKPGLFFSPRMAQRGKSQQGHKPLINPSDYSKKYSSVIRGAKKEGENINKTFQEKNKSSQVDILSVKGEVNLSYDVGKNQNIQQCKNYLIFKNDYRAKLCKKHYLDQIQTRVKRELKLVYKDPEQCYAAFDFQGQGYITQNTFIGNMIVRRLNIPEEDILLWLERDKIFASQGQRIDFQDFKKKFFPEFYLIEEVNEYEFNEHKKEDQILYSHNEKNNSQIENTKQKSKDIVVQRLQDLENILKNRFQHNWISVRRAFLDLDFDHDGFISSQDMIRYFGQASQDIDFNDLTKLMIDKDSKKKGWLSYADFSSWMGVAIHQSEGFYFRHDSIKNPAYEENQNRKFDKKSKKEIITLDVEKTVIDKIHFQWKTLKKAFIDLNKEKTGSIMPKELQNYLKHWGIYLSEEQFQLLFDKFDSDKDGKITYEDFQNTVGNEINPPEHLYFRQDMRRVPRPVACINEHCLQPPTGISEYCQMHLKVLQNQSIQILQDINKKLGKKWPQFVYNLRRAADSEDPHLIYLERFTEILKSNYQIYVSEEDKQTITNGFIAKSTDKKPKINLNHIFQLQNTSQIQKIYQKIDLNEEFQEDAQFVDTSGYLGKFYRQNQKTKQIDLEEFVDIVLKDNKIPHVIKCIKEIDKDNNGYVTNQELDDILKVVYPEQLGDRDLKKLFRKFASIQNTILIDYKKLRDFLVKEFQNRKKQHSGEEDKPPTLVDKYEEQNFGQVDNKELNYIKYILDKQQRYLMPQELQYKKMYLNNLKRQQQESFMFSSTLQPPYYKDQNNEDKLQGKELTHPPRNKQSSLIVVNRDLIRQEIRNSLMNQAYIQRASKSRDSTPLRNALTSYTNQRANKDQFQNITSQTPQNPQKSDTIQDNLVNVANYFKNKTPNSKEDGNKMSANNHSPITSKILGTQQRSDSKQGLRNLKREYFNATQVYGRDQFKISGQNKNDRPQTQQTLDSSQQIFRSRSNLTKEDKASAINQLLATIQEKKQNNSLIDQSQQDHQTLNSKRKYKHIDSTTKNNISLLQHNQTSAQSETSTQRKTSTINELRKILGQRRISAYATGQQQQIEIQNKSFQPYSQMNVSQTIRAQPEQNQNIIAESRSIYSSQFNAIAHQQKGNRNGMSSQSSNRFKGGDGNSIMQFSTVSSIKNQQFISTILLFFKLFLEDNLKQKLAYEWKNIYRVLSQGDSNSKGE